MSCNVLIVDLLYRERRLFDLAAAQTLFGQDFAYIDFEIAEKGLDFLWGVARKRMIKYENARCGDCVIFPDGKSNRDWDGVVIGVKIDDIFTDIFVYKSLSNRTDACGG